MRSRSFSSSTAAISVNRSSSDMPARGRGHGVESAASVKAALGNLTASKRLELFDDVERYVERLRELPRRRLGVLPRGEHLPRRHVAAIERAQPARKAHGPFEVADVVHQFADHHDPGVGFERRRPFGDERIGRFEQPDGGDLFQVGGVAFGAAKLARAALAQDTCARR